MKDKWRIMYKIDGSNYIHVIVVEAKDELEASVIAMEDAKVKSGNPLTTIAIKELIKVEEERVAM